LPDTTDTVVVLSLVDTVVDTLVDTVIDTESPDTDHGAVPWSHLNHPKVAIEFHVNGAMAAGIDHTGAVIIEDMEAGADTTDHTGDTEDTGVVQSLNSQSKTYTKPMPFTVLYLAMIR